MTFNQVNYFLTVAQYLNFTRAAVSLFVTQSTLSRSISALENELEVALLERDYHNVKLTPAGELMYKEMQGIMGAITGLLHRVQVLGSSENGRLVIGVLDGQMVEPSVLAALRNMSDNFPQFGVDIRRMRHQELINDLTSNNLQVAETIITDDTVLDEDIDYLRIKDVSNYLISQKDDMIGVQESTLSLLDGRVLLTPEDLHPGIVSINKSIAEAGISPIIKAASALELQQLWLEAGMGVSICNQGHVIYSSLNLRQLVAAPLDELQKDSIVLLWNKNHCTPTLNQFLSYVKEDIERFTDMT